MADIEKNNLDNTEAEAAAPAEKTEKVEETVKADKKASKPAKAKKSDKPSVPSRIAAWFRSCKSEMKKISWSSPKTVLHNSIMVIITIVVVALVIALLDYVFSAGIVGLNRII